MPLRLEESFQLRIELERIKKLEMENVCKQKIAQKMCLVNKI